MNIPSTPPRVMRAATAGAPGGSGYVPAPAAGSDTKMLRGDGTWVSMPINYLGGVAGGSVPATATTKGDYYFVTAAGTSQGKTWAIGDLAVYEGSSGNWTKVTGWINLADAAALTGGTSPAGGATDRIPVVSDVRNIISKSLPQTGFAESLLARANPPLFQEPLSCVYSTAAALTLATTYAFDTTNVSFQGPTYTFTGSSRSWTGNNATGARSLPTWSWAFMTSSADVEILFRPNGTSAIRYWIWVDGRPITPGLVNHAYASSNVVKVKLAFGYARPRKITFWSAGGQSFGGAAVNSGHNIVPTPMPKKKVMFIGDSWTSEAGTAAFPAQIVHMVGQAFGWEYAINGIGGTGYVAGTYPYTDAQRQQAVTDWAPDYIIMEGSINDNSSAASVAAAAAALYSYFATNVPSAKVIVFGPQPVPPSSYRTSSTLIDNRNALKSSALAAANVIGFVDPIEEQWITGTGNVGSPAGDGNSDRFVGTDSLHLTYAGAHWYAARMIERIEGLLRTAGIDPWTSADPSTTLSLTP